ncbi:uncharacterized protein LOC134463131 [Engraulis encrasicolus]|uniref:uncharacterized protein LOC134463131 n=1 Tax=Engraulis encrasicolus TaxID=184585 RepID=UPI002FCEB665
MVRKCFFRCAGPSPLYTVPKEEPQRSEWLRFIYQNAVPSSFPQIYLCPRHFTDKSFSNLGLYAAGFSKLTLTREAIPTLFGPGSEEVITENRGYRRDVGCQTETPSVMSTGSQTNAIGKRPVGTRTETRKSSPGTQLSFGSVKTAHIRSKGTQSRMPAFSVGIGCSMDFLCPDSPMSSIPVKGPGFRTSKRPRLEFEEEDEDEEDQTDEHEQDPFDETYVPDDVFAITESDASFDSPVPFDEPKYIVFESCLKLLFAKCPDCHMECDARPRRMGTLVTFAQRCTNCNFFRRWESQPIAGSTPVGNLQLSAATYFTGSSFIQLEKVCKAMNLQTFRYDTFRRHARHFLEPAIVHKWKADQRALFQQLLDQDGEVAVRGDMRADSPGHSAKFGCYSFMSLGDNKILDLQLVQSDEVGGSYHMEKEGLVRCLENMESNGLKIQYIVTDRDPQIQKFLREKNIPQFYDVWHFEKGLSKKLEKLSHQQDCEVLQPWVQSIKNHVHWCATSSTSGPEKVAKWTSLINHLQDKHDHDDPLFPTCEHEEKVSKKPSKWLQPGSVAVHEAEKLLTNKRVLKDVEKLSHHHQTSSLESFHSLIIRFAPKSTVFPFMGMLCRLYLASMHFNENSERGQARTSTGEAVYKIQYPKSKKGAGVVKPVKTVPTFNYVQDLMRLSMDVFRDPAPFMEELQQITIPPDLSSAFEKTAKEELIAHHVSRFNLE